MPEDLIKVVIVDDEPDLVHVFVQWLTKRGHEAFGITGGADIVDWVVKCECDVAILDVVLPDANGVSLIAPIRKASPKTHVILMSGLDDPELAVSALREGASEFLVKPIDFSILDKVLDRLRGSQSS